MSDQPVSPPPSPQGEPVTNFNIGEEFGTAKKSLPPARIVAICIAGIVTVLGIVALTHRAKPQGGGSIDSVTVADVPGQDRVLTAITLTLRNTGEKPIWIHTIKVELKTTDGKTFDDEAASGVDLDRYAQAFPVLKQNAQAPLMPEAKVFPGATQSGTVVAAFPVRQQAFDQRKSLAVSIQPYDQPLPIVLTK